MVVKPPRFNAYYDIEEVKPINVVNWKLKLYGRIGDKRAWTAQQLSELPQAGGHHSPHLRGRLGLYRPMVGGEPAPLPATHRRRSHSEICFVQMRRRLFREPRYGHCAASSDHPATEYAREPIADPFGFPLRLRTATKLGYKNAKWITTIEVTNTFPSSYWADRGFNWYAGI